MGLSMATGQIFITQVLNKLFVYLEQGHMSQTKQKGISEMLYKSYLEATVSWPWLYTLLPNIILSSNNCVIFLLTLMTCSYFAVPQIMMSTVRSDWPGVQRGQSRQVLICPNLFVQPKYALTNAFRERLSKRVLPYAHFFISFRKKCKTHFFGVRTRRPWEKSQEEAVNRYKTIVPKLKEPWVDQNGFCIFQYKIGIR